MTQIWGKDVCKSMDIRFMNVFLLCRQLWTTKGDNDGSIWISSDFNERAAFG